MSMVHASVLIAAMAAPVAGAPLLIEDVAPGNAVGVVAVNGLDGVLSRLTDSGVLDAADRAALAEEIRGVFDREGSGIGDIWQTLLEDQDPLEIVASMSGGLVVWVEPAEDGTGQLTIAAWVDLGSESEAISDSWDASWETIRAEPRVKTEDVLGRDVDHVGSRRGDRAGPNPMPNDSWVVREERLILFSNTRAGLTRLLDAVDGEVFDDALGDTEQWAAVKGMLDGPDSFCAAVFVDPSWEAGKLFDQMGMVQMLQGSFDTAVGPVKAVAVSAGPGTGDTLLSWSGGIWMPEGQGGLLRLFARDTPRSAMPGWIGPDTVSVTRLNVDFKRIPDWIRSVIATNPMLMGAGQMIDQFEPTLRAILDPLGRRLLQIQTVTRPLTAESVNTLTAIACTNPTGLSDALAATAPQAQMEPRDFQGHQVWSTELAGMGGLPLPGLDGTVSVAVAGGMLLVGDETAVEHSLRGLGGKGGEAPKWLHRVTAWLPDHALAGWGGWDLAESLTAVAEVERMQISRWEDELKADDPELWEEIKDELVNEDQTEQYERLAKIASHLGPAAWWASSGDDGYRVRGIVMAVEPVAGE
jgi:hypothetical protein